MDKEIILSDIILEMDDISKNRFKKDVVLRFLKRISGMEIVSEKISEIIDDCVEMLSISKMRVIRTREAERKMREYLKNLPKTFQNIRDAIDLEKTHIIVDDFLKRCRVV